MPSYNERRRSVARERLLLNDVLREDGVFKVLRSAIIISDQRARNPSSHVRRFKDAAARAIRSALMSKCRCRCLCPLPSSSVRARCAGRYVDDAVRRILAMKFEGSCSKIPMSMLPRGCEDRHARRDRARPEAARKAMILLKNDKQLLPLDASGSSAGGARNPCARTPIGGYTIFPVHVVSRPRRPPERIGVGASRSTMRKPSHYRTPRLGGMKSSSSIGGQRASDRGSGADGAQRRRRRDGSRDMSRPAEAWPTDI